MEEAVYETILSMAKSGVTVFRLNTSHGTKEDHKRKIEIIREASRELNLYLAILVDLQGPKIRVGELNAPVTIKINIYKSNIHLLFSTNINFKIKNNLYNSL